MVLQEIYSIKLPGNPKLGEGKPENQNHAVIFTRGNAIQTIDMNQVNIFFEGIYFIAMTCKVFWLLELWSLGLGLHVNSVNCWLLSQQGNISLLWVSLASGNLLTMCIIHLVGMPIKDVVWVAECLVFVTVKSTQICFSWCHYRHITVTWFSLWFHFWHSGL